MPPFVDAGVEAVVDLGRSRTVRGLTARGLQNINSWIFLPAKT